MYNNIQNEMLLTFSLYKQPDLFAFYSDKQVKSDYDFSDPVSKFFYNNFSIFYQTFSTEMSENKFNSFMSQDKEKFEKYKEYGGWNTVKKGMELADTNDVKKYFNVVKKYSLIREYKNKGFEVDKIVNHERFHEMTSEMIYRIQRSRVDKVSTDINGDSDVEVLGSSAYDGIMGYIETPSMGYEFPWEEFNTYFRGARTGKFLLECQLSNEGKSRRMINLATHFGLILGKKVLIMSNEMVTEDLTNALVTTVVNHPIIKEKFGYEMKKNEMEIVKGLYKHDKTGEFIKRGYDEDLNEFTESIESHRNNLWKNSTEFRRVVEITRWVQEESKNILFKDVSSDYSDDSLELEIKKGVLGHGVEIVMYDTMKIHGLGDYATLKLTATRMSEWAKEMDIFMYANFQCTDDSLYIPIEDFSSNNLSGSKQVFHLLSYLNCLKRLTVEEYDTYAIYNEFGETPLDKEKTYYGCKTLKNRDGEKRFMTAFEVCLNTNTWKSVGVLGFAGGQRVVSKKITGGKR